MAITSIKTGSSFTNLKKYNDFLAGNEAYNPPVFESIATVTVGAGGASSVTFSSIPSTYQHLQIRMFAKSDRANSTGNTVFAYANGDEAPSATTNYYTHYLSGDGSSVSSGALSNANPSYGMYFGTAIGANATNMGSAYVVDILDYANTNKYKTMRSLGGEDNNSTGGAISLRSSLWSNTAAITSLKLVCLSYNFAQYSHFALYGIKG